MRFVSFLLAVFTLAYCKPKTSESQNKDFAANANGKNFAIIVSYLPSSPKNSEKDVYNWNNILTRGALGKYTIVYSTTAPTVSAMQSAFERIGTESDENSTFVFTFTGMREGQKLRLSDGDIDFSVLINAAKMKSGNSSKGRRMYLMSDASSPSSVSQSSGPTLLSSLQNVISASFFPDVIEFDGQSKNDQTYTGRLATEFSGKLDRAIATSSTQTLREFFTDVVGATKVGESSNAVFVATNQSILNEKLMTVVGQSNVGAGKSTMEMILGMFFPSGGNGSYNKNNNNNGGFSTSGGNGSSPTGGGGFTTTGGGSSGAGSAKYTLLEAALPGCGPCKEKALAVVRDQAYLSGKCGFKIVVEGLADWNSYVGNSDVARFSVEGSYSELRSKYPQYGFTSFPVAFMTDSASGNPIEASSMGGYPECPSGNSF